MGCRWVSWGRGGELCRCGDPGGGGGEVCVVGFLAEVDVGRSL